MERKTILTVVLVFGIVIGYGLAELPKADLSIIAEQFIKKPIEIVTLILIAIGLACTWRELRHVTFARYSELLLDLNREWHSEAIVKSRKVLVDAVKTCKSSAQLYDDRDKRSSIMRVVAFYEFLGILVDKKLLKLDLAMAGWMNPTIRIYELSKDFIKRFREETNQRTAYEKFEKLVKEIIKEAKNRRVSLYRSYEELERLVEN